MHVVQSAKSGDHFNFSDLNTVHAETDTLVIVSSFHCQLKHNLSDSNTTKHIIMKPSQSMIIFYCYTLLPLLDWYRFI